MPMNTCMAPKAKANAPANTPSACADKPNSARKPVAMMAVMVRNAWLSAKPATSASSIVQAARADSSGAAVAQGFANKVGVSGKVDHGQGPGHWH